MSRLRTWTKLSCGRVALVLCQESQIFDDTLSKTLLTIFQPQPTRDKLSNSRSSPCASRMKIAMSEDTVSLSTKHRNAPSHG